MAAAKKETKKTSRAKSFRDILTRDNNTVQAERADHLVNGMASHHTARKNEVQTEINSINIELLKMSDLSTSNNTTTMNAIDEFNIADFHKRRETLRMNRRNLRIKLELLEEDDKFYGEGNLIIEDV